MASSTSVLSQTLKSITNTKIRELEKQRKSYDDRKAKILSTCKDESDLRERLLVLHKSLRDMKLWIDPQFDNTWRWIIQSRYDPSISEETLLEYEQQLLQKLAIESRKLDLADLYSQLLTEWIEKSSGPNAEPAEELDNSDTGSDTFELVESAQKERLGQLREKFSRVVFEPLEMDEVEIDNYLKALFEGDNGEAALKSLRDQTIRLTRDLNTLVIDDQKLTWTVKALMQNDLLNDEKKASLRDFLKDEAVLGEIKDVLNMRLKDINNWEWDLGDDGMPVVPRQTLNGKWRVMMDEDVMQALLTQYIGTFWAVGFNSLFTSVGRYGKFWKYEHHQSPEEKTKQAFYRVNYFDEHSKGPEGVRRQTYRDDFFMAPLPTRYYEEAGGYDDVDDSQSDKKSGKEIKQLLLRTLVTEVLFRRAFDGEVAVVQSDFQWFATGIPHSSIFAVLRFMGFNENSLNFVKKVLEPPLNMLNGEPVRIRKRGLPMAHIFEKLFGEVVLFFLDIAVNQEASKMLYRFHDDLWLVGKPAQCAKAWKTMEAFSELMGLEFNYNKTGSVYLKDNGSPKDQAIIDALPTGPVKVNFLVLDPSTGSWTINSDHVQEHVLQLRKQLASARSVLEWIKTWNSCIGRFFGYTFGEPSPCFGRPHVTAILETHKAMQHFLFGDTAHPTVTSHLKHMIAARFKVSPSTIPDAFLFLPESLGGLGLTNPFISLLLTRSALPSSPTEALTEFLANEKLAYEADRKAFAALSERDLRKRWKEAFDDDAETPPPLSWAEAQRFPSFEEYTRFRETSSAELALLYSGYIARAQIIGPSQSRALQTQLDELQARTWRGMGAAAKKAIEETVESEEVKWLLGFYGERMQKDFGGLQCVDHGLLPLGVMAAMRGKRVTWQMVL